jgi:YebC/PmpR family DNA-binding regulatory protein
MGRTFENRRQSILKRSDRDAKAFSRAGKHINMAVKAGGPDPTANPALRRAMQNAQAVNMPKDKVLAAIEKAAGLADTAAYETVVYEGYGPHGIAFLVETATDNPTRTVANVRFAFKKEDGNLGNPGSVSFMFDQYAVFRLDPAGLERDELALELIDHGLQDLVDTESDEGKPLFELRCAREDFGNLQTGLEAKKIPIVSSGTIWVPKTTTELSEPEAEAVMKLVARLEEDDDVQEVFTNLG